MLVIEDLRVNIGEREVLKGINLEIRERETFVLFGPNGMGKTTLLMSIMGFGNYNIVGGKITFRGHDITHAPIYERARLGIGMSFQRPPTIHGLKTRHLVEMCAREAGGADVDTLAAKVNMSDFLERDINSGFSGGEIKRSELLQLMAQRPHLVLFDEPESGVDLENMKLIGNQVHELLGGGCPAVDGSLKEIKAKRCTSGLIITHTGYILDYVNADRAQVLYNGHLCCESNPREILEHITKYGYQECVRCLV